MDTNSRPQRFNIRVTADFHAGPMVGITGEERHAQRNTNYPTWTYEVLDCNSAGVSRCKRAPTTPSHIALTLHVI